MVVDEKEEGEEGEEREREQRRIRIGRVCLGANETSDSHSLEVRSSPSNNHPPNKTPAAFPRAKIVPQIRSHAAPKMFSTRRAGSRARHTCPIRQSRDIPRPPPAVNEPECECVPNDCITTTWDILVVQGRRKYTPCHPFAPASISPTHALALQSHPDQSSFSRSTPRRRAVPRCRAAAGSQG